jgi:hypothetical protein
MDFTKEELEIIRMSLTLRECRMLGDAELYKKQGNPEAQKDCIDEWRKTSKLNNKVFNLVRSLITVEVETVKTNAL